MRDRYVYCVCRLSKFWRTIDEDLQSHGYKNIKSCIPSVNILKGSRAGKDNYEEVPLLFNYGFIRMSSKKAFNRPYLRKLRKDIPGIMSWLYSLETMHPRKKRIKRDESEIFDDFSMVATVSKKEVKYYQEVANSKRLFSSQDIVRLKIGDYITLIGYPFDGIEAQVEEINLENKTVEVKLFPSKGQMSVVLPFEHVLYTVYRDFDEDKLNSFNGDIDLNQISEENIYNNLNIKQD